MLYYDERGKQIVARQQLTPQTYHRNGVAYAFRRECILEQGTIYGKDTAMLVIDDFIVDVDSELDLKWIEFLFNEGIASLVITSYSIHYTKLYDQHPRAAHPGGRGAGRPQGIRNPLH